MRSHLCLRPNSWTKLDKSFSPCYSHTSTTDFTLPPLSNWFETALKLVCNVKIGYGNPKSENSQDYAQKPQLNYTFLNSASVQGTL